MKVSNGYLLWDRGEKIRLTRNFTAQEFECRCGLIGCSVQKLNMTLLARLQVIREELGAPILVTSAFRCHHHQESLRATGRQTADGTSTHEMGEAVDLVCDKALMYSLENLCKRYFRAAGVAKDFIHVDMRDDKDRSWTY